MDAYIWIQYLSSIQWFTLKMIRDFVKENAESMPHMDRQYIPLCINHTDLYTMYCNENQDKITVSPRQFQRMFNHEDFASVHFSRALHIGSCSKCFELESKRRYYTATNTLKHTHLLIYFPLETFRAGINSSHRTTSSESLHNIYQKEKLAHLSDVQKCRYAVKCYIVYFTYE